MGQTGGRQVCVAHRSCGGVQARGFTLIELMIAIAVAAVLLTVAIPSFKHITMANQLNTTANSIVNALNAARMEALNRNRETRFCSNNQAKNGNDALGKACAAQPAAVYVQVPDADALEVRAQILLQDERLQLSGDITPLRFDARGLAYGLGANASPYNGVVAKICSSASDSGNRRIISMTTGSSIKVETKDGACK